MQPDAILQDVLAATPVEYLTQIEDAYVIGTEDAFIAICRAGLIRPAYLKNASMLLETIVTQAKTQVDYSRRYRVPIEGRDL